MYGLGGYKGFDSTRKISTQVGMDNPGMLPPGPRTKPKPARAPMLQTWNMPQFPMPGGIQQQYPNFPGTIPQLPGQMMQMPQQPQQRPVMAAAQRPPVDMQALQQQILQQFQSRGGLGGFR